jgi:eukaryotic-like serine/threonine-protein kinase
LAIATPTEDVLTSYPTTIPDRAPIRTSLHRRLPERYLIKAVIGRGGMGTVVRAHDQVRKRDVAVKVFDQRATTLAQFLLEAKAASLPRHPNIVAIHELDSERRYMVMELVEGMSLAQRIDLLGKVPLPEVRRIGIELLEALAAAHWVGVVHRDIKPSNVLLHDMS